MTIEEIPNIKKIATAYKRYVDKSCCANTNEDEMILDARSEEIVNVVMAIVGMSPADDENHGLTAAELDMIASRV